VQKKILLPSPSENDWTKLTGACALACPPGMKLVFTIVDAFPISWLP
jgi:hypothetical protein